MRSPNLNPNVFDIMRLLTGVMFAIHLGHVSALAGTHKQSEEHEREVGTLIFSLNAPDVEELIELSQPISTLGVLLRLISVNSDGMLIQTVIDDRTKSVKRLMREVNTLREAGDFDEVERRITALGELNPTSAERLRVNEAGRLKLVGIHTTGHGALSPELNERASL